MEWLICSRNLSLSYKGCGPDQIPNRLLKEIATEIASTLLLIYQSSLKQAKLPDEWKHAYITPIFKNGDRSTAGNYMYH